MRLLLYYIIVLQVSSSQPFSLNRSLHIIGLNKTHKKKNYFQNFFIGDPEASFTKEEMQRGKHQEYEKKLFEQFNNSITQERKTTPSPPALGNSLPNTDCTTAFPSVTKEAWPSLQNGVTTTNPGI